MLRPYQTTALDAMRGHLRVCKSTLLVMPCGSGKGTVITEMVRNGVAKGLRVIFAVHGKALVDDMSERVRKLGIPHGVLMGSRKREHWHAVQVASIDTLHRMENPPSAQLFIIDEADTAMSPTWRKTLDRYPDAWKVGMTATPIRLDGQPLGQQSGGLFETMVLGPSERQLIEMGYLVPSLVLAPPPPADMKAVKLGANDNLKAQAAVCDKAKVIGDIVEHWRKHAFGEKTAAYGVDIAHANHVAESFKAAGFQWAYVDADTPDNERRQIWKDLDEPHSGLMGVASVGCISVGWDHPIVSCIIAARKTQSLRLWRQILGRGSRIYPGKQRFLVLDHVGNTHLHAPYGLFEDEVPWQLEGEPIRQRGPGEIAESVTTCKVAGIVNGVRRLPCYATFKTGPKACPYCGLPILTQPRKVHVVEGELQQVQGPMVAANNERIMRALYDSLHASLHKKQEANGYKSSYARTAAAHVFKKKYGIFPPREWTA
jgi:DNA repair protein RadD